jgi:hypothetical protein
VRSADVSGVLFGQPDVKRVKQFERKAVRDSSPGRALFEAEAGTPDEGGHSILAAAGGAVKG